MDCRCNSGQYIARDLLCDSIMDCLDFSDESKCDKPVSHKTYDTRIPPPAIIHINKKGGVTELAINAHDLCPETHFRCPQPIYCLPVFLRCNRVKDCPYGEDEVECETMECPGYYRCRGSSVCLHPSNMCDGWPQCPQRDDELLCNATCPSVCQCQGLAFVCHRPISAISYPYIRYLDAEGSGIGPLDLSENIYLIYLSLALCQLDSWPEVHLQNLQHLDLRDNGISSLQLHKFQLLQNLRLLRLQGNPVLKIEIVNLHVNHTSLFVMDLSFTLLQHFDSTQFKHFSFIEMLNLSFSSVRTIGDHGFRYLPTLKVLDLSGCKIENFPKDVFKRLKRLQRIKTENYKLCCKTLLPQTFNEVFCYAPRDEISSCEDLLRSSFYRSSLWIIGILSFLGNTSSLVYRLFFVHGSKSKLGYNVFVTNLGLSDLLMGAYLLIIGAADQLYRGEYLWNENRWKTSALCKVAGYMALLSSEVSVFMICLITIDRFIVLHFPFSSFHFKGRSAIMASVVGWLSGLFLAAAPLLTPFSSVRFYGHTGICIPLPVTQHNSTGLSYSFAVMIVFNFVLFVCIAVGQAIIYWSIRSNSLAAVDSTKTSRDLTVARRLITVVVSDFLCWFPIGVLGLVAKGGTHVPGEVNVTLAVFVLPLNSGLNPFLYTFNMAREKRRQAREAKIFKLLQTHATN